MNRRMRPHPHIRCSWQFHAARACAARALAIIIFGFAALFANPASAQLGPGDLQRAHALTANMAGWVALRAAMRLVVEGAGIAGSNAADTADTLAVLLALEDGDGRLDAVVVGAARAALTAHGTRDPQIAELFAEHGLSFARAKAIACLVFGQAPEKRASIVEPLDLSENEVQSCPQAYGRYRDYWLAKAAPLRKTTDGAAVSGQVELVPAGGAMASARAVLIAGRTLDEVAGFYANVVNYSGQITIRALDCQQSEIASETDEIRVCYRLVGALASGIERGIVAGR